MATESNQRWIQVELSSSNKELDSQQSFPRTCQLCEAKRLCDTGNFDLECSNDTFFRRFGGL